MKFNGSTGEVTFVDVTSLRPTAVTMSLWVNPSGLTNAYSGLLGKDSGTNSFYQCLLKSNGKLAMYISVGAGSPNYDGTGTHTLQVGNWYHLAFTYDPVAGGVGYVNGQVDGTFAGTGNINSFSGDPFAVGNDTHNAGRFLNGTIDDARLYNRALSSQEVQTLALSRNRPSITNGLILYAPLDEGLVNQAGASDGNMDKSVNKSSGSVVGTCTWVSGILNYP